MDTSNSFLLILIQVVLIIINAFFASAEIAVISLNENKIQKEAQKGDKKAKLMLQMVSEPSAFLSTIQIAITLSGFLGSAFAADNFSEKIVHFFVHTLHFTYLSPSTMHLISVLLITFILSYFTLVFGEIVPKRIAMKKPEMVARFVCVPVHFISKIFKPLIFVLSGSVSLVLKIFHMPSNDASEVTEDEIRMMIDLGEEKGVVMTDEKRMLQNVFEFNNTSAFEVMTHRTDVTLLQVSYSKEKVLQVIKESGYSRFPVYNTSTDDIVGTVNTKDVLLLMGENKPFSLQALLRPAYFAPQTVRTDILFQEMKRRKNHLAIIVDEYGGMSGIVSLEDLLEEIVGDIEDEYDELEDMEIKKIDDHMYLIKGKTHLSSIEKNLGITFSDKKEAETLSGIIYAHITSIKKNVCPPPFSIDHYLIEVVKMEEHRIHTVKLTIQP